MANTQGFELIIQASKNVIVKALKGAWKSAECPDQPDDTGRIPEFMDIPAVGDIGGFPIVDGQVQISQDELDASFATDVNGVELILGLNVQIEIGNPPIPSAQLLDFHVVLHAKCPVGTLPDTQDVGLLLKDIKQKDVWSVLDHGHPLDANLEELLQDYVHQVYENEEIPHFISENGVSFLVGTCNTTTQIFDDEANAARQILVDFPDSSTLQISIPIYLRMFAFNPGSILGVTIASPMGIETRLIINAPFEKHQDKYVARFDAVTQNEVSIGTISGVGSDIAANSNEANNYSSNKTALAGFGQNLDTLLSSQLKAKGAKFANDLGLKEVSIPSSSEIEAQIAELFYNELISRNYIAIWSPSTTNDQFHVNDVSIKVFVDSLNIALNNTGSGNLDAITNFIPASMEFSIAMSKESLEAKIQQAVNENGFNSLPKRFHEDGKDVDLNSLNISLVNNAIRLKGTVTVIDAIAGSIDVDASFTTDVGLHWEPNGILNSAGGQLPMHHIIGDPDVDVDEGIAFWIIAIILAVISFGTGGVLIGIISIVVILIVKAIIENIGSDSFADAATGAIDGITAWPTNLANIGRVRAVFFDPIEISTAGLAISGQLEVISSCESTQVVPATTAGKYTTSAVQNTEFKALRVYSQANFFWNPGDGSAVQLFKNIYYKYENSGIYLAKHGVSVTEYGGASSRHFAIVRVKNVPAAVNAGTDVTVNEGEVITLEAYFEDVEYLDTHWSLWNFGDNQPLQKGFIEETNQKPKATGVTRVQHAWCDNGIYYVTVQVIDNNGGVGTDTVKVTVLNVPPKVVTPEKIYAYPCSPLTLVGHFTDPGWCDTHMGTWKFGDCSIVRMAVMEETNYPPAAKGTVTASHTYKKCGSYHAECTVIDDDGGIGISQTIVEVIQLKNPNFNEGYSYNEQGKVANEWKAFNIKLGEDHFINKSNSNVNFFCEKCIVFDGFNSQRIVAYAPSLIGIYQSMGANPGWVYQVEAMYMLMDENGIAKLGIDPFGQTDPFSPDIIWSQGGPRNTWSNLLQRVCAKSNLITIFLLLEVPTKNSECCFDGVDITAMQNITCISPKDERPQPKRKCIDFNGLNSRIKLPAVWEYRGISFISMNPKLPNKIMESFPPDHTPSLEIGQGLILKFGSPMKDVTLEFSYYKTLYVGLVTMNEYGYVLSKTSYELKSPNNNIYIENDQISKIQIFVRGEGGLSKICFYDNLTRRSPNREKDLIENPYSQPKNR